MEEMIIVYYGTNSLKQFIRGKPIRFGHKLWALCGSKGYCFNFSLKYGKEFNIRNVIPLDTWVGMKLTENIVNPSSYTVYFDNSFTNIDLLKNLPKLGFRATETIQENPINHKCPSEEPVYAEERKKHILFCI
ncbi:zinc finger protein [Trichonephila clavata]|uniref:Zinc finger protein n=1 Tax=Trichonephila clavata TaxID=2740835 RepID=A0A8X6KP99_TRICU|nr:zinc finger protein [Trichonephila clavata]